jgi:Ca-activated chloride channel family protein
VTPAGWFLRPDGAPLLFLAAAAWTLLLVRNRARGRALARALGDRAPVLTASLDGDRRRLARAVACAGLFFSILAALQPVWGEAAHALQPRGAEVVVCLDVSRSMLARDAAPHRLEAARREVLALANHARGDRLALVLFAGKARLVAPLTNDLESFGKLVEAAEPESIDAGGSDVAAGLRAGLDALAGRSGDHAAIVLVSDGEDIGRQGRIAAEECRARDVAVHTVGIGTGQGSKIPVETDDGEAFLRDRSGAEVQSALDAGTLRAIAEASGGAFVHAPEPDALVGLWDGRILPAARRAFEARESRARPNRFQWALLVGVVLWLLDLGLSHGRRP